jgi:phosphodiesterase/alkaline phosphatase D-like protein
MTVSRRQFLTTAATAAGAAATAPHVWIRPAWA